MVLVHVTWMASDCKLHVIKVTLATIYKNRTRYILANPCPCIKLQIPGQRPVKEKLSLLLKHIVRLKEYHSKHVFSQKKANVLIYSSQSSYIIVNLIK